MLMLEPELMLLEGDVNAEPEGVHEPDAWYVYMLRA